MSCTTLSFYSSLLSPLRAIASPNGIPGKHATRVATLQSSTGPCDDAFCLLLTPAINPKMNMIMKLVSRSTT